MKSIILLGIFLIQIASAVVSHKDEQIWRVFASADKKPAIKSLIDRFNLDVWSTSIHSIDILIKPDIISSIDSKLKKLDLSYEILINDIQTIIDIQEAERNARPKKFLSRATIDVEVYHDLGEIYAYIDEIAAEFEYITVETIGYTIEGREMKMLRLATKQNNENAIWVQCGIHAREWITPATCLFGLDHFTNNYGHDADVTAFLDSHDVYMVVVTNPDGYVHTWSEDRNWRKNRRQMEDQTCVGVDLNRNYDDGVSWGGSSDWICSITYQGVAGFSEPETAAIRDKVVNIQETQYVKAFYDLHSYGNLWLFAYGYKADQPPHFNSMDGAAAAAAAAILPVNGTIVEHGSSYVVLYEAFGTSKDWGYAYGIVYSYTIELRDDGEYGFFLPEDQIVLGATEAWRGIFAADAVMK